MLTVREQFIQEGYQEVREAIAIKMLNEGMPIDKVAKMTELTIECITQLKQKEDEYI